MYGFRCLTALTCNWIVREGIPNAVYTVFCFRYSSPCSSSFSHAKINLPSVNSGVLSGTSLLGRQTSSEVLFYALKLSGNSGIVSDPYNPAAVTVGTIVLMWLNAVNRPSDFRYES